MGFQWPFVLLSLLLVPALIGAYAWHLRRRSRSWHSPEHVQMEPECLKLHTNSHRDSISGRFEQALVDVLADARDRAMADREHPAMAGVVNG